MLLIFGKFLYICVMCQRASSVLDVSSYCAVVWLYGCHDFICMMMMIMTVAADQFHDVSSLHEPRLHLVCLEGILDAILDLMPLECSEKNATLIFFKAYDTFLQNQVIFFF